MRKILKKQKGFTLIELIVVIAIIAILAAVIAPNAMKAIGKSKVSAAIGDIDALKTAVILYATENDDVSGITSEGAINAYLDNVPSKNPWGGSYNITYNATDEEVIIEVTNVPSDVEDALVEATGGIVESNTLKVTIDTSDY